MPSKDGQGKYYHTKKDYLADMKKYGMQPYSGPKENKGMEYKPTEWAIGMGKDIEARKGRPAGDRFHDELKKRDPSYDPRKREEGKRRAMQAYEKYGTKGGFDASEKRV